MSLAQLRAMSFAVWVERLWLVDHNILTVFVVHVEIQFVQLVLEVEVSCLVVALAGEILLRPQSGLISAIELEHIAQGSHSLDVHFIQLPEERKACNEGSLEVEHLLLVSELDHGEVGCKVHVLQSLFVGELHAVAG